MAGPPLRPYNPRPVHQANPSPRCAQASCAPCGLQPAGMLRRDCPTLRDAPALGRRTRSGAPMSQTLDRAEAFCDRFGLQVPILLAPMAGACPPALSIAVANAGGLG